MNAIRIKTLAVVALLVLGISAMSQERKIQRTDLPAAVEKAVVAQSQGAKVLGFAEEKENGHTYYEAELLVNGHSKDVLFDKNGNVVEVEEQVAIAQLPADVKAGLHAKAGKGQLVKVESLTKHGKLVAYEAQVNTRGKNSEVQVGPDGKPLTKEE